MAKKKKSRKGRVVATGGIVGLILFYLLNGNFSFDLFGDGEQLNSSPAEVEIVQEQTNEDEVTEEASDLIVEVIDNKIYVNDKEVMLDKLIVEIGDNTQVIYRAKDAKQITYEEVKTLLNSHDIVVIEE